MTTRRFLHGRLIAPLLSAIVLTGWPAAAWAVPAKLQVAQAASPVTLKQRVAVMEFRAINVAGALSAATVETLRSALIQLQRITVIERAQIEAVLREQRFNQSGLVEGASAVALGRLLGANAIVVGSVTRFGDTYLINARALDATTGEALTASQVSTVREDEIPGLLQQVARTLFPEAAPAAAIQPETLPVPATMTPPDAPQVTAPPATAVVQTAEPQRPTGLLKSDALFKGLLVPSWGQFYAEEPVRGWVTLSLLAVSLGLMAYSTTTYYAPIPYPELGYSSSALPSSYSNRPFLGIGFGLGVLTWLGSAIDAFIVTKEAEPVPGPAGS
jgi:TolB-like protein